MDILLIDIILLTIMDILDIIIDLVKKIEFMNTLLRKINHKMKFKIINILNN